MEEKRQPEPIRGWWTEGLAVGLIILLAGIWLFRAQGMTEETKIRKAGLDCQTLSQAIQKYQSLEGVLVEKLMDLKGKYLTCSDTTIDPWKRSYQLDKQKGVVFSGGPDRRFNRDDASDPCNADNIEARYR